MKYYIVWNKAKTEAFVTDCRKDALATVKGKPYRGTHGMLTESTVGSAFHAAYDDEKLKVEAIDL